MKFKKDQLRNLRNRVVRFVSIYIVGMVWNHFALKESSNEIVYAIYFAGGAIILVYGLNAFYYMLKAFVDLFRHPSSRESA